MAKLLGTIKALITRIIFGAHGFIAIWQVTENKKEPLYWYLCTPIVILFFEGLFTLAIKKNQEWRWFCPSVFCYLSSVVPAIWLLELDKVERRLKINEDRVILSSVGADLKNLDILLGGQIKLPDIQVDAETWITLIEQFLMLILIIGRWLLPKGDLTRDQLSQLLLVYIGTAADIIEFFDSFKDSTIANEPLLVLLTLGIWSWSLLQFTIVLSATRSRKPRGGGGGSSSKYNGNVVETDETNCCNGCCCGIDAWGIALNILLQDAPFLAFRLLIIIHYKIISYMNVFFTCKNTLVILLQLYRLYVVHSENRKSNHTKHKQRKTTTNSNKKLNKKRRMTNSSNSHRRNHNNNTVLDDDEDDEFSQLNDIYIIENDKYNMRRVHNKSFNENKRNDIDGEYLSDDDCYDVARKRKKSRHNTSSGRKDTGYSTASSQTDSYRIVQQNKQRKHYDIGDGITSGGSQRIKSKGKNNSKRIYDKENANDSDGKTREKHIKGESKTNRIYRGNSDAENTKTMIIAKRQQQKREQKQQKKKRHDNENILSDKESSSKVTSDNNNNNNNNHSSEYEILNEKQQQQQQQQNKNIKKKSNRNKNINLSSFSEDSE